MNLLERKFEEKVGLQEFTTRYRWAKLARNRDRKTLYQFITDEFLETMEVEFRATLPHFPKQISFEALDFTAHKLLADILDNTFGDYDWAWDIDGVVVSDTEVDWVHGDTQDLVEFLIKDCKEVREIYEEICDVLESRVIDGE